ncbi:MAG: hypothetical protein Kow00124_26840 [Anaerolineae bacterium]
MARIFDGGGAGKTESQAEIDLKALFEQKLDANYTVIHSMPVGNDALPPDAGYEAAGHIPVLLAEVLDALAPRPAVPLTHRS